MPDPIRVFLLDDHDVVRQGLRFLLEQQDDIEVVGESGTATTKREPSASSSCMGQVWIPVHPSIGHFL